MSVSQIRLHLEPFIITAGKLVTVAEKEVKGAPYTLVPMTMADGSIKLLASINSTVSGVCHISYVAACCTGVMKS